jgi:hypothetical protein
VLASVSIALAQGTRSDYERALSLPKTTANKVFKQRVTARWLPDNAQFWYRNDLPNDAREFILVNAEAGTRRPAFDHQRLAAALGKVTGKQVQPDKLPIETLSFDRVSGELAFTSQGKRWRCDLHTYELREMPKDDKGASSLPVYSEPQPSVQTGEETQITFVNRTKGDVELYWIDDEGQRVPYATIRAGEQHQQHTYAGHAWLVTDKDGKTLAVFVATEEPADAVIDGNDVQKASVKEKPRPVKPRGESPDGKWFAFIKEHNLHVQNLENGEEIALSSDGTEEDAYSERLHWSPDSEKLVALRTSKGDDRKIHLIESSPKDQLQPKLHTLSYPKPGDSIPIAKPQLFNVVREQQIPLSDELFPNPWSISEIRWMPDSSRFTLLYNQRGHQVLRIIDVNAVTGETRAVIDEQSKTFIDYAGKQYSFYLDAAKEIIWMSEREGWNHLYLYDAETGCVKNQITKGPWVVRGVENVDEDKRQIWFLAGGILPGAGPLLHSLLPREFRRLKPCRIDRRRRHARNRVLS